MRKCPYCAENIEETSVYCNFCGSNLPKDSQESEKGNNTSSNDLKGKKRKFFGFIPLVSAGFFILSGYFLFDTNEDKYLLLLIISALICIVSSVFAIRTREKLTKRLSIIGLVIMLLSFTLLCGLFLLMMAV